MEGWQKGADAVLRLSSAGKERYFKRFPERKSWFEANHPEHFGRSVSKATTSLKKVTTAKQKKQRLAAIRQAAEKINQLKISSDAVRAMGERRRQSGEGLGGGLETNRDIIAYATAGNYIKSGGLGSLYEQSDAIVKKGDKWIFKGVAYNSQKDAIAAMNNATAESPTTSNVLQSPSPSKELQTSIKSGGNEVMSTIKASLGDFAKVGEIGLNVLTSPNPVDRVLTGIQDLKADWQKRGMWGRDWPKAGQGGNWEAMMRQQGKPVYMSDVEDLDDYLQRAPAGSNIDTRQKRLPFSTTVQVGDVPRKKGEMYFTGRNMEDISEDKEDMSAEENNFAKELAEKVIEEKRLQECMPMAMMIKASPEDSEMKDNKWDYMDSWKDNPIKKGSSSSEAEDEPGEYDYEGDMAKSQLRSIMHNSKMLHDLLEDNTNLPEWVQSKITLAEDYILTAANYMRGEMERMDEEKVYTMGNRSHDSELSKYLKGKLEKIEQRKAAEVAPETDLDLPFEPNAEAVPQGSDMAQHGGMSRAKHLAKMALRNITQPQPASADELVAQHVSLHTPKEGEMMEEGAARKAKSNDLVKRSMLPDRSVIPAGKGFGDDIPRSKKEKIMKKIGKALQKKRMVLPTDNPSENELVPQSMLPDVPGYPEGYQMEEQVVEQPIEQPVEQQVETPVVEENASPFVSAGSKFLTRTSARLVYGDKND